MNELSALLQRLIQQAAELADEFSEEEMQEVLMIFSEAARLIQESESQQAPIQGAQTNQITPGEFPSSNVQGFKFDPKKQELLIQYHGPYPQAEGPIYSYSGVPEYIFKILERGAVGPKTSGKNRYHEWFKGITPSHGASVNALIKAGGFSYRKIA